LKIRAGFVTNSSSSSFVCLGVNAEKLNCSGFYRKGLVTIGGSTDDVIGIEIETLLDKFQDRKVSELKGIVADELNTLFNTSFTEKDIFYYEEGWYEG